jgi:hypothetical protein
MLVRTLGLALVALMVGILAVEQANAGKDKKDGKDKKFEIPKDAIAGKLKSVDLKKASFTITLASGKDRSFAVDKATEFYGPKGGDRGTGPDGLKDDTMSAGYEIKVVATKDGKTAKDVYLPVRKAEKDKKDKK